MEFEANMTVIGIGNMMGKGTVTINGYLSVPVRLMKYTDKEGRENSFVSFPQRKVVKDGKETWEPIVSITDETAKKELLRVVQEAVVMDFKKSVGAKVNILRITVIENDAKLQGIADVQIGGIVEIQGIRIYRDAQGGLYTRMPQINSQREGWQDAVKFNNSFTYKDIDYYIVNQFEMYKNRKTKVPYIPEAEIEDLAARIAAFEVPRLFGKEAIEIKEWQVAWKLRLDPKPLYETYVANVTMMEKLEREGGQSEADRKDLLDTLDTLHDIKAALKKMTYGVQKPRQREKPSKIR